MYNKAIYTGDQGSHSTFFVDRLGTWYPRHPGEYLLSWGVFGMFFFGSSHTEPQAIGVRLDV